MEYNVEIIFGKDQIKKYLNNEDFLNYEKTIYLKKYKFETFSERNAFYKGLRESKSWRKFEVIKEYETKSESKEEEKELFDYWAFIEKHYPNYYHCDQVLLSDILTRKLNKEEVSEKDSEYIKDWDIRNELLEIDKELLCKAFENFFNSIYPEK